MTPFLEFALLVAIAVFAAKGAGYLSYRLGQPMVLGEILAGLILGPTVLNVAHFLASSEEPVEMVHLLGELGVLMLMFIAGLELHLDELTRHKGVALWGGLLGGILPVVLGGGVAYLLGMPAIPALFLGLTLGATSVSISAQTLMELGVLRSRVGVGLLGAAVIDDVVVILLVSVAMAVVVGTSSPWELILIAPRMVLYVALAVAIGIWLFPRVTTWVRRTPISQGVLSLAVIVMLLYGVAAEVVGHIAPITGAFIAGLMFARTAEREHLYHGMSALAYGLFVPLFFVSIGLGTDLRQLSLSALLLVLVIIAVAVVSKWVGAGLGAVLGGFSVPEAIRLGAGMISRGEMGLIIASLAMAEGWFTTLEFASVLGTVVGTTVLTPPLLRYLFRGYSPK